MICTHTSRLGSRLLKNHTERLIRELSTCNAHARARAEQRYFFSFSQMKYLLVIFRCCLYVQTHTPMVNLQNSSRWTSINLIGTYMTSIHKIQHCTSIPYIIRNTMMYDVSTSYVVWCTFTSKTFTSKNFIVSKFCQKKNQPYIKHYSLLNKKKK